VINKTKEISNDLIKQVKSDLKSKNLLCEKEKKEINVNQNDNNNNLRRLSIFENFIPKKDINNDILKEEKQIYQEELKVI